MSRTADNQTDVNTSLSPLYDPVAAALSEVEEILRREMQSPFPYVNELVQYGCLLGGKRLRPALLLLAAQACGKITREHLILAAVVEMIHTATLVHDDVLDKAAVRRHLATVNARWDTQASVLLGDFLFTHAFFLASTLDSTLACRLIGRATNRVCEGEIRQKGNRGDCSLSEDDYLQILEAKTAELCACCCHLGARFAEAPDPLVQRLGRYGRALGIAFQIADDLLDLDGDEATVGKSLGTDWAQQKPTLPMIRALAIANATQRRQLLSIWEEPAPDRWQQLQRLLHQLGAIQYTRHKALEFASTARAQLAVLPPGAARQTLVELTDFVVQRSH